jgi:hypothetical protein
MQQPERVFAEIYRVLKPGGVVIMSFSNRMFYTKAIQAWRDATDYGRIGLVKQYFMCVQVGGWVGRCQPAARGAPHGCSTACFAAHCQYRVSPISPAGAEAQAWARGHVRLRKQLVHTTSVGSVRRGMVLGAAKLATYHSTVLAIADTAAVWLHARTGAASCAWGQAPLTD